MDRLRNSTHINDQQFLTTLPLMKEKEQPNGTLDFDSPTMQLIAQEQFRELMCHESFKSYLYSFERNHSLIYILCANLQNVE